MKKIKKFLFTVMFASVLFPFIPLTAQNILGQNQYKSPADELLNIDRLTVAPFFDNANGIYARPLERHLIDSLSKNHRYNYIPPTSDFPPTSPESFLKEENLVKEFGQKEKVEAFLSGRITNYPTGLEITVYLFLTKDGQPLIYGELKNLKNDSIDFLKGQLNLLVLQIFERLPYAGHVMSREGLRVTVNLGAKDGIKKNAELSVVQFISLNRHPKHKFLINTEKEVIGKIKILKVEPTLSFGVIQLEKEKGIIDRDSKINTLGEIVYSNIQTGFEEDRKQSDFKGDYSFGENPKEWKPLDRPVFGKVTGKFGLSRFQHNMSVQNVGSLSGKNDFSPMVDIEGELWLTSEWTAHAQIRQGLISVSNPRSGSAPGDLSQSLRAMEVAFGYRFRFSPDGPSSFAEPFIGYFSHQLFSDNAQPEAFTTMKYSGLRVGMMGEFPITEDQVWRAGGKVSFALSTNLKESPVTSGASSDNSSVQFQFYGSKAISGRMRAIGSVDFEQFSTNFSGAGTRVESADSASLRYMTFSGGISYSF